MRSKREAMVAGEVGGSAPPAGPPVIQTDVPAQMGAEVVHRFGSLLRTAAQASPEPR